MKKIINFIKYNNAFTIIFAIVLFSTGGAFANEKVRDTVIGQTIVKRTGVDNTQIITADLENFDMGLKINGVKEDIQFYYVNFDYNAIDVKDGVWQTIKKEKNMNVSKTRLGNMDLGLYLAEELKQLTDQEMAYMKEVQNIEKNKGLKKQTESVEYTGLKGLVFNNETKELIGYEPVKEGKEEDNSVIIDAAALTLKSVVKEENKSEKEESEKVVQQITVVKETISKETIMQMVKEALAQEQGGSNSVSSSSLPAGEAGSSSSSLSSSLSSSSSSVVSGGGSQSSSEAVPSSSSSESSLSAGEAGLSAGEAGSSSTESSSSAESSSSSEAVSSSSEAASLPASEASSSSVAI